MLLREGGREEGEARGGEGREIGEARGGRKGRRGEARGGRTVVIGIFVKKIVLTTEIGTFFAPIVTHGCLVASRTCAAPKAFEQIGRTQPEIESYKHKIISFAW